jgi:UDP-N-acetylglucosamine/UDP-N-acetylgalactosamine diphosphorylase
MNYEDAKNKLTFLKQQHLLKYWDSLTIPQRAHLLEQIEKLDIDTLNDQIKLIHEAMYIAGGSLKPFTSAVHSGNQQLAQDGFRLIREGQLGCLVLAGGQGSRLRFDGPKGLFPISIIKKKTLLQLVAEKTLAASRQAGKPLLLCIMTSPLNDDKIQLYFQQNNNFGLDSAQISFYNQKMLPFLDMHGKLFLEATDKIAEGPDGNGEALTNFYKSGIAQNWATQGVKYVHVTLVDNPLADPYDAELVGYHAHKNAQVTLKATLRRDEKEKVGIIVKENGHVVVKEYSEVPTEEFTARSDGILKYTLANLSMFCFSMDFISSIANTQLPLHKAFKATQFLHDSGQTTLSCAPNAWKYEKMIFDVLPLAQRVEVLVYPREVCFSPLKNAEGLDSGETVQKSLQLRDYDIFSEISQTNSHQGTFELSQQFYYPTKELKDKWRGVPLPPTPYVAE